MTTIAYHHKSRVIACDGRSTQGIYITQDDAQKWIKVGDDVWFFTGTVADREMFLKYHHGEAYGRPEHDIESSAILASGGECFEAGVTEAGQAWRVRVSYDHGAGSGKDHAVAAMDHGKSAAEAVKYASTRDTCTGGKITVFDLATMSFVGGDNV